MTTYFWQGRLVRLRAVEPSDGDIHFVWNQDSDMTRRLDRVWFPQSREGAGRWAEQATATPHDSDDFHFEIDTLDGEMVGSISTHTCDRRNSTFEFGVAIRADYQQQGFASDAIRLVLRYYFEELRYQKATVHVYDFNTASIALFERLGFQREGRLRRMVYTQGQFFDTLIFGLTDDEYARQAAL